MCKLLDTVRTANVKEAVAKQALYMLGICTNLRGGRCICRHRSSRTPSLYTRHCSCSCICTPGDPQIYPGPASLTAACDAVMVCMQACTILAQLPHSAAWAEEHLQKRPQCGLLSCQLASTAARCRAPRKHQQSRPGLDAHRSPALPEAAFPVPDPSTMHLSIHWVRAVGLDAGAV